MLKQFLSVRGLVVLCCLFNAAHAQTSEAITAQINLPPGFTISIFAEGLEYPRSMVLGSNGVVFVGSTKAGKVYALQDSNGDGKADKHFVIAENLNNPNGVAYRKKSLYVGEINRILRFDDIMKHLAGAPKPAVVFDQLPDKHAHGWKYLRFGPDDKLYTAVGAPCNVCNPEEPIYTSLIRMNPDGSDFEILARGIRNSVGFDWQPDSKVLFFSDNGRDNMGDDIPPDELNKWTKKGQHFGFPFCHGGDVPDPKFGKLEECKQFVAPVWRFKAHMAALGLHFYRGKQFPKQYRKQLFVALRGSWNRTIPQGYQVALVQFKKGNPVAEQVFADGWLTESGEVLGRPVDIIELTDGSILVSDDHAGVIYRIAYTGKK